MCNFQVCSSSRFLTPNLPSQKDLLEIAPLKVTVLASMIARALPNNRVSQQPARRSLDLAISLKMQPFAFY